MSNLPPDKLSIKKLCEILDPFQTLSDLVTEDFWKSPDVRISPEMVQMCLNENYLNPNPYLHMGDYDNHDDEWTLLDHAARIAWMVANGCDDPIELDFGIPSLGHCWYPLIDGHHRLAAAIFRKDDWILANCSGSVDEIDKYRWIPHNDAHTQEDQSPRHTTS